MIPILSYKACDIPLETKWKGNVTVRNITTSTGYSSLLPLFSQFHKTDFENKGSERGGKRARGKISIRAEKKGFCSSVQLTV